MKKLKLHDEVEAELAEVFQYYSEQNANVALRFYEEITNCFSHIVQQPKIGVAMDETYRKLVMPGFHYNIIYKETTESIKVDAIAHPSREPGYWAGRK